LGKHSVQEEKGGTSERLKAFMDNKEKILKGKMTSYLFDVMVKQVV